MVDRYPGAESSNYMIICLTVNWQQSCRGRVFHLPLFSIVAMEPNGEKVLQRPRSVVNVIHIEGVMQHENNDAWRHSFGMVVKAPPQ